MNKLIGSDIEFRVRRISDNTVVPAGVLPITGTKGNPEPLKFGGLEIDCCGVEITPKPASCENEWVDNIFGLKNEVDMRFTEFSFECVASHLFDFPTLRNTPHALTMGCQPDFCAWSAEQNPGPDQNSRWRTYGGHIHIEGGNMATVVACDTLLGIWSLREDDAPESLNRRSMYGKAGAYRDKPYGVEYRVLSNFWARDEKTLRTTYRLANYARTLDIPAIKAIHQQMMRHGVSVQRSINAGRLYDVYDARAFWAYFDTLLEKANAQAA